MKGIIARRVSTVLVLALCAIGMFAVAAFAAQTPTDAANSAISSAATDGKNLITTNIPVLLAVTGVWVALAFGRRLVKKVMGS